MLGNILTELRDSRKEIKAVRGEFRDLEVKHT